MWCLFWRSVADRIIVKPELIETGLQTLCPKIWNTAELFNFIEKAVFAKAGEHLNREAGCKDLPTTVTPERSHAKYCSTTAPSSPPPHPPSRVEVLPYMGSIGMYGLKGYSFSPVLVINRVSILVDFGHFGHKGCMVFVVYSPDMGMFLRRSGQRINKSPSQIMFTVI